MPEKVATRPSREPAELDFGPIVCKLMVRGYTHSVLSPPAGDPARFLLQEGHDGRRVLQLDRPNGDGTRDTVPQW